MTQASPTAGVPAGLEVISPIGMGAFGKVFLVRDPRTGQRLALKRLERLDPGSVYRFKQEFRALADVKHKNLVRLHELFSIDGSWCFTMDHVDGVRFDTWVRGLERDRRSSSAETTRSDETDDEEDEEDVPSTRPPHSGPRSAPDSPLFNEQRLRDALRQLVDGVLTLHAAGILHRDLKPSNVLVTKSGQVVILDFGLAATTTDAPPSSSDGRFGTPAYMSPEQARGGALTMAADWYAVGVMLYEALSGQLPFGGSAADMLAARLNRSPRDVTAICSGLPEDLADLAMALLDRNPTARPNGFQIAQRVGLDPTAADSPRHVLGGAFVGRTDHLHALRDAFDSARQGKTVVAHVHGPSGYGKTTLVRRFLAGLSLEREVVILEGRCYERESVPFKALDDLVDALGRYLTTLPAVEAAALLPRDSRALVRLFPALGRLEFMTSLPGRAAAKDPQELRRRAFRALRDMFARITDSRPVVLFIDDVHWGDADSAQLVRNLLAPPDVPPMLLVVGYRGETAGSNELLRTLQQPVAADSAWETVDLPVGPLSREETRELAESLLSEGGNVAATSRIANESGGSPLFISELARFAVTHSDHSQAITLQKLIAHRVSLLPDSAQKLLRTVACTERPLGEDVLSAASGISVAEMKPHLERLRDEHLIAMPIDVRATGVEILHDKLRLAVREGLSADDLREYHAALAVALEHCGSEDLESIAHHHAQSGSTDRAKVWLERAADRADASLAFDRAVTLYRAAMPSGPGDDADRIQRKLAEALVAAGRGPEAAQTFLALAGQSTDENESSTLRRRAAEQYLRAGHVAEGLKEFGPLLERAGLALPKTPGTALASLLWSRGRLKLRGFKFKERQARDIPLEDLRRVDYAWIIATSLNGIDVVRSANYHAQCLLLALQTGEPVRISRSLAMNGAFKVLEHMDGVAVGSSHIERAQEIAERIKDSYALGWATAARSVIAFANMNLHQTVELADEASALLRDRSDGTFREISSVMVWFALHAMFLSGRLTEFARLGPACAREAEARGDRYTLSTVRAYDLALHWAVQDRPEQGRREADAAIADWPEGAWYHQHWARLRALCFMDLYEGQGASALTRMQQFRPRLKKALQLRIRTPRFEANYLEGRGAIEAALAEPSPEHVRSIEVRIADLHSEQNGLAEAYALLLEAGLATIKHGDVLGAYRRVEQHCTELGMPLHRLACVQRQALHAGDTNRVAQAEAELLAMGVKAPSRFIDMLAPSLGKKS